MILISIIALRIADIFGYFLFQESSTSNTIVKFGSPRKYFVFRSLLITNFPYDMIILWSLNEIFEKFWSYILNGRKFQMRKGLRGKIFRIYNYGTYSHYKFLQLYHFE